MKPSATNRFGLLTNGFAFALGILVCAGLWIAWSLWIPAITDSDRDQQEPTADSIGTESGEIGGIESTSPDLERATAATFDEIISLESGFARNYALYNLVLDLDEAELLELINRTNNVSLYQSESHKVIVERLYDINPEFALDHADQLHPSFVTFLFHQWAKDNLADAIVRARSLEDAAREAAFVAIRAQGSQLSAEQRAEIARELDNREPSTGVTVGQRFSEIQGDAEKLWNEALREGRYDSDHIDTLVGAGISWIRQSGFEVIDGISAGLEDVQVREQILASVLLSVSRDMDMETIFWKAVELENDPDDLLLATVIGHWTASDPKSALEATNEVESYTLRNRLQRLVAHNWAYRRPRNFLDELDRIPQNLQSTFRRYALEMIAQSDPREAILLTQDLDPGANKTNLVARIATNWAEQDPQAALAWASNNREFESGRSRLLASVVTGWSKRDPNAALDWILGHAEYPEVRHSTIRTVLKNLANRNPELALQRALEQPIEDDQVGLEQAVVHHIAQKNLQLAREMLQQTRDGVTRQVSYASVGVALVRASRGVEAVELASDLRGPDRDKYIASILWNWVDFDAKGLHDSLSNIADPEIRASAAASLIVWDNGRDVLTNEQKKFANEQLGGKEASDFVNKLQTFGR